MQRKLINSLKLWRVQILGNDKKKIKLSFMMTKPSDKLWRRASYQENICLLHVNIKIKIYGWLCSTKAKPGLSHRFRCLRAGCVKEYLTIGG
jgi:hypothetical protein